MDTSSSLFSPVFTPIMLSTNSEAVSIAPDVVTVISEEGDSQTNTINLTGATCGNVGDVMSDDVSVSSVATSDISSVSDSEDDGFLSSPKMSENHKVPVIKKTHKRKKKMKQKRKKKRNRKSMNEEETSPIHRNVKKKSSSSSGGDNKGRSSSRYKLPTETDDDDSHWSCSRCTLQNEKSSLNCVVCLAPAPRASASRRRYSVDSNSVTNIVISEDHLSSSSASSDNSHVDSEDNDNAMSSNSDICTSNILTAVDRKSKSSVAKDGKEFRKKIGKRSHNSSSSNNSRAKHRNPKSTDELYASTDGSDKSLSGTLSEILPSSDISAASLPIHVPAPPPVFIRSAEPVPAEASEASKRKAQRIRDRLASGSGLISKSGPKEISKPVAYVHKKFGIVKAVSNSERQPPPNDVAASPAAESTVSQPKVLNNDKVNLESSGYTLPKKENVYSLHGSSTDSRKKVEILGGSTVSKIVAVSLSVSDSPKVKKKPTNSTSTNPKKQPQSIDDPALVKSKCSSKPSTSENGQHKSNEKNRLAKNRPPQGIHCDPALAKSKCSSKPAMSENCQLKSNEKNRLVKANRIGEIVNGNKTSPLKGSSSSSTSSSQKDRIIDVTSCVGNRTHITESGDNLSSSPVVKRMRVETCSKFDDLTVDIPPTKEDTLIGSVKTPTTPKKSVTTSRASDVMKYRFMNMMSMRPLSEDSPFTQRIFVATDPNGGALSAHVFMDDVLSLKEKASRCVKRGDASGETLLADFAAFVVHEFLREDEAGDAIYVIGIVHSGGMDFPDFLGHFRDHHGKTKITVESFDNKHEAQIQTIREFSDNINATMKSGTHRSGVMRSMSIVGTVQEESGGMFPDVLDILNTSPFFKVSMPWGSLSRDSSHQPYESDDGPIFWVRPGEQMVPIFEQSNNKSGSGLSDSGASSPVSSRNRCRTPEKLLSQRFHRRFEAPRRKRIKDRTGCHADHAGHFPDRHPVAAIAGLQAPDGVHGRVVKKAVLFRACHMSTLGDLCALDYNEEPLDQCIYPDFWLDEAYLNLFRRQSILYANLNLLSGDLYWIPRRVVHQFHTVAAASSIGWHLKYRAYYSQDETESKFITTENSKKEEVLNVYEAGNDDGAEEVNVIK